MKSRYLIILSVGANIALLGYLGYLSLGQGSADGEGGLGSGGATVVTNVVTNFVSGTAQNASLSLDWETIRAEDLREYIGNLRTIGCPEATIRDIIAGRIRRRFATQRRELYQRRTNQFQFWKTGGPIASLIDNELVEKERALLAKKRRLWRRLFDEPYPIGPDWVVGLGGLGSYRRVLGFLSSDKRIRVMEIEEAFALREAKAVPRYGPLDRQDRRTLEALRAEKEAALKKVLTPEEKQAYDLRLSETATRLRRELIGFQPTKEEFTQLVRMHRDFQKEHGWLPPTDSDERKAWKEARAKIDKAIGSLLGEDRYGEYRRAQDEAYQVLAKIADRQGLEKKVATEVYEMKQIAENQVASLRTNRLISAERREEALNEIRAETERSIADLLGTNGLKTYKSLGAGWLTNLSPEEPNLDRSGPTIIESFQ